MNANLDPLPVLYIPVRLIWQIQIRWQQKFFLLLTLGLTIIMIAVTITRASGLHYKNVIDSIWGIYWMFVAAEVALMMTSMAAFRSLFVAWGSRRQRQGTEEGSSRYAKGFKHLQWLMSPRSWRSRSSSPSLPSSQDANNKPKDLGEIPGGTMTGIRTFIHGHRKSRGLSRIIQSRVIERDEDINLQSASGSPEGRAERGISIQHHIRVEG